MTANEVWKMSLLNSLCGWEADSSVRDSLIAVILYSLRVSTYCQSAVMLGSTGGPRAARGLCPQTSNEIFVPQKHRFQDKLADYSVCDNAKGVQLQWAPLTP